MYWTEFAQNESLGYFCVGVFSSISYIYGHTFKIYPTTALSVSLFRTSEVSPLSPQRTLTESGTGVTVSTYEEYLEVCYMRTTQVENCGLIIYYYYYYHYYYCYFTFRKAAN
jgi:hypothetical protein